MKKLKELMLESIPIILFIALSLPIVLYFIDSNNTAEDNLGKSIENLESAVYDCAEQLGENFGSYIDGTSKRSFHTDYVYCVADRGIENPEFYRGAYKCSDFLDYLIEEGDALEKDFVLEEMMSDCVNEHLYNEVDYIYKYYQ